MRGIGGNATGALTFTTQSPTIGAALQSNDICHLSESTNRMVLSKDFISPAGTLLPSGAVVWLVLVAFPHSCAI
ncbi:unnamed protein product [Anisakis simplex]|uniref:Uncharacterized protein n=1 Tax=Anisakis simplex TaxID=6269 RepID=A0A0M3K698_ANISI|nr:unnamed protein product [Anisakis simplex]